MKYTIEKEEKALILMREVIEIEETATNIRLFFGYPDAARYNEIIGLLYDLDDGETLHGYKSVRDLNALNDLENRHWDRYSKD